ncbi:MAG: hypothetical protein OHK0053_29830 [Microscillaceae bacterium]
MKIYCPKCEWEPRPDDLWWCSKCSHEWHTFDTQGQCPNCKFIWKDTQCLSCHQWSRHHDWYHDLPPVEELLEEIVTAKPNPA